MDISAVFPHFDAAPNLLESCDFVLTDFYLQGVPFTAYFAHKPYFDYLYETYDCWVAFVITRGSFHYRIGKNGESSTANTGELVLCPPHLLFYRKAITPLTLYIIKFSGSHSLCAGAYYISDERRLRQNLRSLEAETVYAALSGHVRLTHYWDIWYQLCEDAGVFSISELDADSPQADHWIYP